MGGAPIGFLARAALLFCACPGIERRPRLLRLPDLLDRADAAALLAPLPSLSAAIRIRRGRFPLGLGPRFSGKVRTRLQMLRRRKYPQRRRLCCLRPIP
jgi:hypothetical protein